MVYGRGLVAGELIGWLQYGYLVAGGADCLAAEGLLDGCRGD